MKKIMELLQNMKAKNEKKDNKGFSLVELIIVIAIMAILVGIVGTQVIPYINKSKVAKDQQLLNSISTAAVAAYSENAMTTAWTLDVFGKAPTDTTEAQVQKDVQSTIGYNTLPNFTATFGADGKADIKQITVQFDITKHKAITHVEYNTGKTPKYPIKDVEATI